jgi:hypothetical protein
MELKTPLLILTIALLACSSCQRRPTTVTSAFEALKKLDTAAEIGVTYEQYSDLLIDAKLKVETANASLEDGILRSHLNSALDNYLDAGTVWKMMIRNEPLYLREHPGQTILPKYSIQVDEQGITTDYNAALTAIWKAARYRMALLAKEEEQ